MRMSAVVIHQILGRLETLPESLQQRVLEYVRSLQDPLPPGVPGNVLAAFSDEFPPDDLRSMKQVIEEGCERVDLNEW
jgi:hypothetical protein